MSIYGNAANCVAFMQHFAPIDRAGRNSHLLGYHFNPNDYFLMADSRGFPADLGDLGYGMLSHCQK